MVLCVHVFLAIVLDAFLIGLYFKSKNYHLLISHLADVQCIYSSWQVYTICMQYLIQILVNMAESLW